LTVKSLKAKLKKALKALEESQLAFEDLDSAVSSDERQSWLSQEQSAMLNRGNYLAIYNVNSDHSENCIFLSHALTNFMLMHSTIKA
jgi:hypothetical protein